MDRLPYNIEAEQAVLGSILSEPPLLEECKLRPECFYHAGHALIYQFLQYLQEIGKPIDILVVVEAAGEQIQDIGGVTYLFDLMKSVPSTANFKYYEEIVYKQYLIRKTVQTLNEKSTQSNIDDPAAYISDIQSAVNGLVDELQEERSFKKISDVLLEHEHMDMIWKRKDQKGLIGVKTAGSDLDRMTTGYQKQDLIILAARPSVGKTAFMLNNATKSAESGVSTFIFSIEMPELLISERIICSMANIDGIKLKTGQMDGEDWDKYSIAVSRLSELPLFIDDTPGISIQQIAAKVKQAKKKFGNIIVFVDYLQLISGGKKFSNTHEEVKFVSSYLKRIARENDCPLMAISSLSRSCEQRQDKRPMLSDLRDSGQIEFDADTVMFLYRDDYYDKESEKKNIIEIIVAKGRNTGTGVVEMAYLKNYSKFLDLDRGHHDRR